MDQKRTLLYVALIAILFFLWEAWQKDYPANAPAPAAATATTNGNLPPVSAQAQAAQTTAAAVPTANTTAPATQAAADSKHTLIPIDTDVLHAEIDTQGGNLVKLSLTKYPQSLDDTHQPIVLLNNDAATLHIAQSGLIGKTGPDTETGQATYRSEKPSYTLDADQDTLQAKLSWRNAQGVVITKVFTFQRGKYDVTVSYQIDNKSAQDWSGQLYAQLRQVPPPSPSGIFALHTYQGASISSTETPYEKISFSNMEKSNLDRSITGGWLALQQRYFLSAWVPDAAQTNRYYTRFDPTGVYTVGYVGPVLNVPAGQTITTKSTFYGGPEIADPLKQLAPHLDLTIDYGWLSPISQIIFVVMKYIHSVIGNWGWSIVLVTLLIKLLFYRLSATSYRSMAKMRKLTPQLQALKERFGDDRQKMGQATMELYKREKANPLSGCLPMIVQIPFFIALYYVLVESVELRQAPFMLWIHDLSIHDPFFVLPILMGISMFLQQKLNPPPPDPIQAKVMMLLPVVFTVFFAAFPAGLVLYWLVNNCVGALQQWHITRQVEGKKR